MSTPADDPFGERIQPGHRTRLSVLGGHFTVESSDAALLQLAIDAYGGLPRHRLGGKSQRFNVRLTLSKHRRTWAQGKAPPEPVLSAGNGLLCATLDAGNFAIIDVAMSRALISISRSLLSHAYHARYELIELAFLTLASRAQRLVPLHAACLGANGSGMLVMGSSGTGKSTLSLCALAEGMRLLSDDSAFVALENLRVTGVPNYLHLQKSSLDFMQPGALREQIERSPIIQRRSGARKFEVNLRDMKNRVARSPLQLAGTVMLSSRSAGPHPALEPLDRKELLRRLRREQPYALGRDNWQAFERRIVTLPAYELRRTKHPDIAVQLLRDVLGSRRN